MNRKPIFSSLSLLLSMILPTTVMASEVSSGKDLLNWELVEEIENTHGCIDASAFQMPDGTWKMWYKSPDSKTYTGVSKNLETWEVTGLCEIDDVPHEGPIVFYWKVKYMTKI